MKPILPLLAFCLFCAACATNANQTSETAEPTSNATDRAIQQSQDGFGDAALSPLEDVNLKRAKIPDEFKELRTPYAVDPETSCDVIAKEVNTLDGLLGRDWDIPPPDEKGISDRAADGASTAFLDAVSSGASGFIPYRGLVRTVTGANSHATKVRKAYERGSHRRTFLKGIGLMKGCAYPAAPLPLPEEDPRVVFR